MVETVVLTGKSHAVVSTNEIQAIVYRLFAPANTLAAIDTRIIIAEMKADMHERFFVYNWHYDCFDRVRLFETLGH